MGGFSLSFKPRWKGCPPPTNHTPTLGVVLKGNEKETIHLTGTQFLRHHLAFQLRRRGAQVVRAGGLSQGLPQGHAKAAHKLERRIMKRNPCWGDVGGSPSQKSNSLTYGYESKISHQNNAGVRPCFQLPGICFAYLFLTHSHVVASICLQKVSVSFPSVWKENCHDSQV